MQSIGIIHAPSSPSLLLIFVPFPCATVSSSGDLSHGPPPLWRLPVDTQNPLSKVSLRSFGVIMSYKRVRTLNNLLESTNGHGVPVHHHVQSGHLQVQGGHVQGVRRIQLAALETDHSWLFYSSTKILLHIFYFSLVRFEDLLAVSDRSV